MEKVAFTDELRTGIASIDGQHARLIELLNELIDWEAGKGGGDDDTEILDELFDYIDDHFRYEESLMKEAGYPAYESHHAMHGAFVKKSLEFRRRGRAGDVEVGVDLLAYLSQWLIDHIRVEDAKYAPMVRSAGY